MRIATGLLNGERQPNTEGSADLWAEFVSELGLKTTRRLHLVRVKGHSTKKSADALASVAEATTEYRGQCRFVGRVCI